MSVIDFRVRPLYGSYLSFVPGLKKGYEGFGFELTDSVIEPSVDTLIKELDEADVVKSVLPGRGVASNPEIFELDEKYPGRFILFPFIDVTNPEQALKDIDELIINGKGQGATIEPYAIGPGTTWHFDDERIDPVYKKLEENNIPVMGTVSGWVGPYTDNTLPAQIDRLLFKFPKLIFIAAHAAWPWFNEIIPIAYKHPNLYLTADFEALGGVQADIFRYGAEHMAKGQVLFASGYPIGPVKQIIDRIKAWNLPKEEEEDILYGAAARILGLDK